MADRLVAMEKEKRKLWGIALLENDFLIFITLFAVLDSALELANIGMINFIARLRLRKNESDALNWKTKWKK